MKLRILNSDPAGHWLSVHKAGCADLKKRGGNWDDGEFAWVEEHDSITDAAESIASDFIQEGSMTLADAVAAIHFYPCVTLPLYSAAQVAEALTVPADEVAAALRVTYRLVPDGAYSSIERCHAAPDGVAVFGSFAEAKAELLSSLKAARDLWADAVRLARDLKASDVAEGE